MLLLSLSKEDMNNTIERTETMTVKGQDETALPQDG